MNIQNFVKTVGQQRLIQLLATMLIVHIAATVSAQSQQKLRFDRKDAWLRGPVVWNQAENAEGLLVGVRMHPSDGVLRAGQPLEIQYVLKNCSEQEVHLSLTSPVKEFMFDLHGGNTLLALGSIGQSAEIYPTRIAAGEVFDEDSRRTIIQTLGLTQGEYVLPILPVFSLRTENRTTSRGIGYVRGMRFRIEAPGTPEQSTIQPETASDDLEVLWGEQVAGMQLGAQLVRLEGEEFVGKSGRFHAGETMELQLRIRNNTNRPATLEIQQPQKGRTWLLHVKDVARVAKKVAVSVPKSHEYRPRIRMDLSPGKSHLFTATRVKTATHRGYSEALTVFKEDSIDNARLKLLSTEAPILSLGTESVRLEIGGYSVQVEVKAKHLGSDFTLVLKSGDVPFRIARKLGSK